jgi:EAL domain-containing protein (putative c-di-GMP-specific phosphodiesterase class I)
MVTVGGNTTTAGAASVGELIADGAIRAVYQPIVDLDTGAVVAYEALARGPRGSELEMPGRLFPEASRLGLLAQLDREARASAIRGAIASDLADPTSLFVNVEPTSLDAGGPLIDGEDEIRRHGLRIVVEFTERELAARPADVLRAVAWLRARGWGIALDDIGADRRSLALLPFLAPDVLKLDMALVQQETVKRSTAHVVNAVAAEAERSGALVLAEGIETDAHLNRARAFGARLGQGWLFGRPDELPAADASAGAGISVRRGFERIPTGTPFSALADRASLRTGTKRVLLALSRQLEAEAEALSAESVVLATFQEASFFTPITRGRYERLARGSALVGALGVGMDSIPAPGVRGGQIAPDDPLRGEWDVVVISPHFAGAFVARDLGSRGADLDREFEFSMSYDRDLVLQAARMLLERVVPSAG